MSETRDTALDDKGNTRTVMPYGETPRSDLLPDLLKFPSPLLKNIFTAEGKVASRVTKDEEGNSRPGNLDVLTIRH